MAREIELFGVRIDAITMDQAVARLTAWIGPGGPGFALGHDRCQMVVTPNVHHVVMLRHRSDLQRAYQSASMVVADGTPVVVASRVLNKPLPERVAGSDLVPALFDYLGSGTESRALRVFLLGAGPGVGQLAGRRIEARWKGVEVVGTYSPLRGFEHDEHENTRILELIAEASPDVLVVGLGAPKQELWTARHLDRIAAPVALCVGATIDFLAGHKSRSPVWMRRVGLEWLHRLASEPKRLISRYAHDAVHFPSLVWREWRQAG